MLLLLLLLLRAGLAASAHAVSEQLPGYMVPDVGAAPFHELRTWLAVCETVPSRLDGHVQGTSRKVPL